jgi:hypothetical protein
MYPDHDIFALRSDHIDWTMVARATSLSNYAPSEYAHFW